MSQHAAISLRHITATYEQTPALWNVSIDIPRQALAAVIGPNGAGKTTLLKVILGLMSPVSGSVIFATQHGNRTRPHIAYVPQRRSVDWDFPVTVLDVVMMGCYHRVGWFYGPPEEEYQQAYRILKRVDLFHEMHRSIARLSGGQQQRVFLARALMQDADIYLLDEPFVGIDINSEQTVVHILQELRDAGKTLLVVHHDLHTVQSYFDWVILLNVELIASGRLETTFTQEYIAQAYGTSRDIGTIAYGDQE